MYLSDQRPSNLPPPPRALLLHPEDSSLIRRGGEVGFSRESVARELGGERHGFRFDQPGSIKEEHREERTSVGDVGVVQGDEMSKGKLGVPNEGSYARNLSSAASFRPVIAKK